MEKCSLLLGGKPMKVHLFERSWIPMSGIFGGKGDLG